MTTRLLAIGTDPVLLMTRGEVLKQEGYSVTTAHGLVLLTQPFDPFDFDLIILCHTLSEDERRTIAAFVRQQSPFTPIMAVSPLDAQRFDYADLTVANDPARMLEGIRQMLAATPRVRQVRRAG